MHSSICFTVYLHVKGFSVVNQQILFPPKGIYLQINRQKKIKKKKDIPTPTPGPSRRFTDTPAFAPFPVIRNEERALKYLPCTRQSPWGLSRSILPGIIIALQLSAFFRSKLALYNKNNSVLLSQALCDRFPPQRCNPFDQRHGSRALAGSEAGSPRITDFRLCAQPQTFQRITVTTGKKNG